MRLDAMALRKTQYRCARQWSRPRHLDGRRIPKRRERARNRLGGEPQIVRRLAFTGYKY